MSLLPALQQRGLLADHLLQAFCYLKQVLQGNHHPLLKLPVGIWQTLVFFFFFQRKLDILIIILRNYYIKDYMYPLLQLIKAKQSKPSDILDPTTQKN